MRDEIIFQLEKIDNFENDYGIWKHFYFSATKNGKKISGIAVDRLKETKERDYDNDFLIDYSTNPPVHIPYLFAMNTEEEYRGNGIAGELIEFANSYFKERFGIAMQSGVINEGSAPRVWEKLAEQGKAIEYDYEGDRRWAML